MPGRMCAHTHPHSDWGKAGTPSSSLPVRHDAGVWEETHAEQGGPGRACKLHTDSGPGQELIFFFSHQHCNEMTLNETRLFEDLLRIN